MKRAPLIALLGATLLALDLVATITLADGESSTPAVEEPPLSGPAVRIAGRADLVTLGVAVRARSL